MKHTICISLFALLISACTQTSDKQEQQTESINLKFVLASQEIQPIAAKKTYGVEGYYTGFFNPEIYAEDAGEILSNKITVSIDSLSANTLYGHSVVAGNMRSFKGPYSKNGYILSVTANEPGDDKYDGQFAFILDVKAETLSGSWVANDKTIAVTERSYSLTKKPFMYDPNLELTEDITYQEIYDTYNDRTNKAEALTKDVLKVNPSKTLLKKSDVNNMYQADLEVLRNSIYARHGYSFKNRRMRTLFDNTVEWYMPVSIDVTNDLTDIEKKNIELLKRYETHASKYYDVFGR